MMLPSEEAELRVLVLTPTGRDSDVVRTILDRIGVISVICTSIPQICRELELGAAALLLAEEAVTADVERQLSGWIASQPPWSDLPVLVLALTGADSGAVAQALELLGNVTVLERPTRVAAFVSAVRTGLRARQRQYQIRSHLREREVNEAALRDADQRKDEFLATLAHELRNPLAPIRNALQILRLGGAPPGNGVHDMMERQVNHMVRLVDDLMDVSRVTRGKIDLAVAPVEAAAVVRDAVETSAPLIEAAAHRLSVELAPEPLLVAGDRFRLSQVVANLLNNAARYTPRGGRIEVRLRREDGCALISVSDNGVGIEPHMLPRVFDLFTQVKQQRLGANGGLGIGLTLVKTLVEMHGGQVLARSSGRDRGSQFSVRLPLAPAPAPAAAAPDDGAAQALPPRRVLVVDDNQDAAESLGTLLEMLGARVHVVFSGLDALDAIDSYLPDFVMLDIGMPLMDGYEVARRIRERPTLHHVTLIALTGWGQEGDRRRSMEAGFNHHMVKPPDVTALEKLLACS